MWCQNTGIRYFSEVILFLGFVIYLEILVLLVKANCTKFHFFLIQSNPENTVGILTMAGKGVRVLVTPTSDLGKILACMHGKICSVFFMFFFFLIISCIVEGSYSAYLSSELSLPWHGLYWGARFIKIPVRE